MLMVMAYLIDQKEIIYNCEGITSQHIKEVPVKCDCTVKIQYLLLTYLRIPYSQD